MSKNLFLYCLFNVSIKIHFYFYFNIARDVVTVLLIFFDIHHFNYKFSDVHVWAHTHKHTCMIGQHTCMNSTQEEWRELGTRTCLGGAGEGFVRDTGLAHTNTHQKKKNDSTPRSQASKDSSN